MDQRLNGDLIRELLSERGWQQGDLAKAIGASDASISQWIGGEHAPRPGTLLKLAKTLQTPVETLLVATSQMHQDEPKVAFRRKGQQKTTDFNEEDARSQAYALENIASYLEERAFRPREFQKASTDFQHIEELAALVRKEIFGNNDTTQRIEWMHLINWFSNNGANLVPVFWGERVHHGNALHVFLPSNGHTFIYVNLDSEELDFKFWLAHEMAHMLTPSLVGDEKGEDFADAFAGSLLFPQSMASSAYSAVLNSRSQSQALSILKDHAVQAGVSLFTVYTQCKALADAKGASRLQISEIQLHKWRRSLDQSIGKIRKHFFSEKPSASEYVEACRTHFKSKFFDALFAYLQATSEGPTFISRVLHCALADGVAIRELLQSEPDELHHH